MKRPLRLLAMVSLASSLVPVMPGGLFADDEAKPLALRPVPRPDRMEAHESFNEISKSGEATLVFLGDSITAGWAGRGKEVWDEVWAPLGAANFGIGGDRTEHLLWRLDNGNYDGLEAKLTVLMIGTNNTGHQGRPSPEHGDAVYQSPPEDTAAGVAAVIEKLREKQPGMKILLLAIFPRGADADDPMRQQNEATNALIAELADGETVHYLDIGEAFLEPDGTLSEEIMPDLLHLSPLGYRRWADAIHEKVAALLD